MKLINRYKKYFFASIVIFFLVCTLTGCQFTGYKGEFPELYTVAVNSLLGMKGYHSHGDAIIKLIEEDTFGRKLFSYYEDSYYGEGWPNSFSYLICQKIDGEYVYYYADYNFISKEWNGLEVPFTDEDIGDLKMLNDWGKEINEEKLTQVEISRKKNEPKVKIERKDFDILFQRIAKEKGRKGDGTMVYPYAFYLTSDAYGRSIYYVTAIHKDIDKEDMELHLVIIFNPDGSFDEDTCIMELKDLYNYQDDLKELKEANNWNKELE
jgi:hypothetical protein